MSIHVELVGGPFDGAEGPMDHYVIPSAVYVSRATGTRRGGKNDLLLNTRGGGELYVLTQEDGERKTFQHWALNTYVPDAEMAEGA